LQAKAADAQLADGSAGALTGVPLAHKDIFVTKHWKTTAGSKILNNYISPFDAHVVAELGVGRAGMVCLGKVNMDEFAMGSSNESAHAGPTKNPWDITRVPGGSSGGSAAAIAAGLAPASTGTDTGGSIRQPAAFCGITGIKPTYGRVSRYGMIAYASSLDQAGPMAKTAEDCAIMLNAMAGHDAKDSTCLNRVKEDYTKTLGKTSINSLVPTANISVRISGAFSSPCSGFTICLTSGPASIFNTVNTILTPVLSSPFSKQRCT
jgi:aspartyl-tRNA(Asn)/glutamyl-tRNA(Gln) amidotransferase subunit A